MSFLTNAFAASTTLMNWVSSEPQELPSPINHRATIRKKSSSTAIVEWINGKLEIASQTLGNEVINEDIKEEINDSSSIQKTSIGSELRQRKVFATAYFPSYLNNEGSKSKHNYSQYNYTGRRTSLLDGIEETLSDSIKKDSVSLSSPKKNFYIKKVIKQSSSLLQKLSKPLKQTGNEIVSNLLPVPLQLHHFNCISQRATLLPVSSKTSVKSTDQQGSTKKSVIILIAVFILSCLLVYTSYRNFPDMTEEERSKVKLPRDLEDAKELGRVLYKYKDTNYYEVITTFFITYIFLQTFAIPGSVFLSILSGFMYPFYIALFLVCLCSGIGATGCYYISYFIGTPLVHKYLEDRVRDWNTKVDGHRGDLFNYLLFLRITPFLPNWFINIVSPIINIPVYTFFIATFIGVAPLSFIAIQAGTTLYQLTTAGDAFSVKGIAAMAVLAVLSLVPVMYKKYKEKSE